jgi:hypothetical protein
MQAGQGTCGVDLVDGVSLLCPCFPALHFLQISPLFVTVLDAGLDLVGWCVTSTVVVISPSTDAHVLSNGKVIHHLPGETHKVVWYLSYHALQVAG